MSILIVWFFLHLTVG